MSKSFLLQGSLRIAVHSMSCHPWIHTSSCCLGVVAQDIQPTLSSFFSAWLSAGMVGQDIAVEGASMGDKWCW
jgi:hypothetical protein